MKLKLSYFFHAITIPGIALFANAQKGNDGKRLRVLSDMSLSTFDSVITDEFSISMSMMATTKTMGTKSSKSGKSTKPLFVPAPIEGPVIEGITYLQNRDFEEVDPTKFNIDLNLELSTPSIADTIASVRNKWMRVIIGDLPPVPTNDEMFTACSSGLPGVIDDTYICVKEMEIDGEGGVIGYGTTIDVRNDVGANLDLPFTALISEMGFDTADVAGLTESGLLEDFALRMMARTLNFDPAGAALAYQFFGGPPVFSFFFYNYIGENGLRVWNDEWGCVGVPPLEDRFQPQFWQEQCFGDELMTETLNSDGNRLSGLTLAYFDDLGYTVNYDDADDYDGSDTTCCNGASSQATSEESKPSLSESGRAAAIEYGFNVLNERKRPANEGTASAEQDADATHFKDHFITVFTVENGVIYDVHVAM